MVSLPRFTVSLSDIGEGESRSVKRIIVHPDSLKALKLCSGDVIALSQGDNGNAKKVRNGKGGIMLSLSWYFRKTYFSQDFAIGVLWPSIDVSQNGEYHVLR